MNGENIGNTDLVVTYQVHPVAKDTYGINSKRWYGSQREQANGKVAWTNQLTRAKETSHERVPILPSNE